MGSLFLFHIEDSFITIQYSLIFSSLAGIVISVAFMSWYLFRQNKKQQKVSSFFLPVGAKGQVLKKFSSSDYQIKVQGEIWRGTSEEELEIGMPVEVTQVNAEKLFIKIKKLS
jgi:membrane protein implicated in regulation of membrane protease activity